MRHRKHNIRFGRQRSHYKQTMRHLVMGLIVNKSIKTTKVKAKETSRLAEKLVTIARNKTVANQRKVYSVLRDRKLVAILFDDIAPLFKNRNGGYTRVMLTTKRKGDNAQMAILEFVEKPKPELPKKVEKKKEKAIKPEVKPKPEKVETLKPVKPEKVQKEKVVKKKEEPPKKEEPLKVPEVPKEPKAKPGIFKRIFGRKKENK